MKLQTNVPLSPSPWPISYESKIFMLGSCFVTNIGTKLQYYKFPLILNPFGILYHPQAISQLIGRSVRQTYYDEEDLISIGETWHCFDAHSDLSRSNAHELLQALNEGLEVTRTALKESTHMVITLGTSWAYRLKTSGKLVANCHKVPQREFSKELLSVSEVTNCLMELIADIRSLNPNLHCIFTVSPVRHLKDGFTGNQRSKAHLISALHTVIESLGQDRMPSYFPAYEIFMDELREYRYYDTDMMHPNQLGIQYVWEKFRESYIDKKAFPVMEEIENIQKSLLHRPFKPESEAHKRFRDSLDQKMKLLIDQYPFITFEA